MAQGLTDFRKKWTKPILVSSVFALFHAGSAGAQPTNEAVLDVVVVTAQKRAENQQDVPIAITSLNSKTIERANLSNATQLTQLIPGLQVNGVVGDATPIYSLRGVSMFDFSFNQSSPVALYKDEVYKGNFAIQGVELFDLERVEVLRGPQGTLYGKNTTGGAINLITKKPDYTVSGQLRAGYGNFNRREVDGAVQFPVIEDVLAVRGAFTYAKSDGWFENVSPGQPDLEGTDQWGARLSVLFEPSEDLTFNLIASKSQQDPVNYGILGRPGPLGVGAGVFADFNAIDPVANPQTDYFRTGLADNQIEDPNPGRRKQTTNAVSLTANLDISPSLSVTSITSYDQGELFVPENTDGAPIQVIEIDYRGETTQFTQDLRLATNFDGPFNFIVGAYYQYEDVFNDTELRFFNGIDVNTDGTIDASDCVDGGFFLSCRYGNSFDQTRNSTALYGDGSFEISPLLKLRGGIRVTREKADLDNFVAQVRSATGAPIANTIPGDPTNLNATFSNSLDDTAVTGKVGVDFTPADDLLFYASYSQGFRAGAFNAQAFFSIDEATTVDPETIDAFEVGFKTQLLGRRLQLNGAAFSYKYDNQQIINVNPSNSAQQLINVDKSTINGAELELAARPFNNLTFTSSLSYLDAEFDEAIISGADVSGNTLPNAPKISGNVTVDWRFIDKPSFGAVLHLDGSFQSRQFFEPFNVERIEQSAYGILNGNVTFEVIPEALEMSFWAKNITDEFYITNAIDVVDGFGLDYIHRGAPRSYGFNITYRY
ncbi:MAG: TonB-dependent receptor [Alphaproteobacteria bacterium]|nr:TonB-dependent receptor [Alphaproteobacteria bacterium]